MDFTSLAFVAAMVIVGGIAGYSADVIGRNIGKKRISPMRRLRPKHFAALSSAVAGMLIPLATVGVLYTLSSDVRVWLNEGRRAINDRDKAIRERTNAMNEVQTVIKNLNESRSKSAEQLRQLNELNAKKAQAETQLSVAKNEFAAANQKFRDIQKRLSSSQQEYRALQGTYATLSVTFGELRGQYKVIEQRMKDADQHGLALDIEMQRQRRELAGIKKDKEDLEKRKNELDSQLETLKLQSDSASKIFDEQIREQRNLLETEKLKLDQARAERTALEDQNESLRIGFQASRQLPMIFARGDELARDIAGPGLTQEAARSVLLSVLRAARSTAIGRQAAPPPGGREVSGLFDQRVNGVIISVEQQENAVISAITRSREPVVVIAHSLWNAFRGEFVPLTIDVLPNPVIYEKGARILEARIDGGASEGEIINQFSQFLQGPLTEKALKDGMIPAIGKESPLGNISRDTILDVVREVASTHRMVRVGAYAADTIRAGDALRLEFRVR